MPSTISANLPSYTNHPTSIPPSRTSRPLCKNHADGLKLPTPLTYSEQVVWHIPGYGLHQLSLADSPLAESLSWAQSKEPKPVTRLSLREARPWQVASLEAEAISAGTATCSEHLPTPSGSRILQDTQSQGPKGFPRPTGTLGGNTLTGTDCMFRGMVSNTQPLVFPQVYLQCKRTVLLPLSYASLKPCPLFPCMSAAV